MKEKYIGIIEIDDNVITIVKRGNVLIGGGATNCGLVESYKWKLTSVFHWMKICNSLLSK